MKLNRQRRLLRREIGSVSQIAIFVQAKAHYPALARYGTIIELLDALESTDGTRLLEKEQLLRLVLLEHEERPQPLWAGLLVLTCFPMLITLSWRVQGQSLSDDECNQLVLSSFLEVISAYSWQDNDERVFMHLRRLTHRRVFRLVQKQNRILRRERPTSRELLLAYEAQCIAAYCHAPWPAMRSDGRQADGEREEQTALLAEQASAVLSREKLALVTATLIEGLKLRDCVKRMYPSATGDEHQRLYERIKRRHSRALQDLRDLFTPRWRELLTASTATTR